MKRLCFFVLTLALVISAALVLGHPRGAAWALSPDDLAGTWIAMGDGSGCGGPLGERGGMYFKMDIDGNYFRMTRLTKGFAGIAEYEGIIKGKRLKGIATIDLTMGGRWVNGRIFTPPISGSVGDGGRTIVFEYKTARETGAVGNRVTGWRSFYVKCKYERAD